MDYVIIQLLIIVIGGIFWGIIWGYATRSVVQNKGYADDWFWYGFFFGLIAFLLAMSKPDYNMQARSTIAQPWITDSWICPSCSSRNNSYAITCSCGTNRPVASENPAEKSVEKTRKKSRPANSPSNINTKQIPVRNYYPGFPIRISSVRFQPTDAEAVPIELVCHLYQEGIAAVRVEILLTDIWGEQKSFPEIDLQIPQGAQGTISLPYVLRIPAEKIPAIQSVHVTVDKALIHFEIQKNEAPSTEILLADQALLVLRERKGEDAVTEIAISPTEWTCICGTRNARMQDICTLCNRTQTGSGGKDSLDINLLLQKAEEMASLKEIYTLLDGCREATSSEKFLALLKDLENNVEVERLYGNMKDTAISLLQNYREDTIGSSS